MQPGHKTPNNAKLLEAAGRQAGCYIATDHAAPLEEKGEAITEMPTVFCGEATDSSCRKIACRLTSEQPRYVMLKYEGRITIEK